MSAGMVWFLTGIGIGIAITALIDRRFPINGYDTEDDEYGPLTFLDAAGRWHGDLKLPELPAKPDDCASGCPGCSAHEMLEIILELGDRDCIAWDAVTRLLPTATHGHVQR